MSNLCKFGRWNDAQFVDWDCQWYSFQIPKDPPWGPSNFPPRGGDREAPIVPGAPTGSWVDYGRKPYLSRSHHEMMRRIPLRASFDQALQKKSQFEKPYFDDEYPEMQHWVPEGPLWFDWQDTGPTDGPPLGSTLPPINPFDPTGPGAGGRGLSCTLFCDGDIGRCGDCVDCGCDPALGTCYAAIVTVGSKGTWHVRGAPYKHLITGRNNPQFKNHPGNADSIQIHPDWDKIEVSGTSLWGDYQWKKATFQVTYCQNTTLPCTPRWEGACIGEVTVSCCTTCACPSVPAFAYTSGNPSTIAQEATATITVDNGCANYSWSVSGTGFSFVNSTTTVGSNTLQADDTACGTASITVTDKCGTVVTGYVRCTTGTWTQKCTNGTSTTGCSPWSTVWGGDSYETIVDYKKWEMIGKPAATSKCCPSAGVDCTWDSSSCPEPPCGNPCDCDGVIGRCGGISVTLWPSYKYYEWECA